MLKLVAEFIKMESYTFTVKHFRKKAITVKNIQYVGNVKANVHEIW